MQRIPRALGASRVRGSIFLRGFRHGWRRTFGRSRRELVIPGAGHCGRRIALLGMPENLRFCALKLNPLAQVTKNYRLCLSLCLDPGGDIEMRSLLRID